jgi:hypothetical protein
MAPFGKIHMVPTTLIFDHYSRCLSRQKHRTMVTPPVLKPSRCTPILDYEKENKLGNFTYKNGSITLIEPPA